MSGATTPQGTGKQAVVLIHGIGEQRPMETLRGFVDAVWTSDPGVRSKWTPEGVWSKPDTISGSYELRRLTTGQDRRRLRTDFFEFYWAHLMEGNAVEHVAAWARMLLLRSPLTLPAHLRGAWALVVLLALVGAGVAAWVALDEGAAALDRWPLVATLMSLGLSALVSGFVVRYVGDAARYLNASPPNIRQRHAIRTAGVKLLRRLHNCGEYERIIVVGHSLGSVIGYDVLTHAWARFHQQHDGRERPARPETERLESLAAAAPGKGGTDPDWLARYRAQQARCRAELRATGMGWLVTDFVTLGSPLAHGAALLARSEKDLERRRTERELPSCPPQLEPPAGGRGGGRFTFRLKYVLPSGRGRSVRAPHHGAVFGPTRWTNLYFPERRLLWGDFVGGPIAPVFGSGVRDVAVRTRQRFGIFAHTLYWTPYRGECKQPAPHIVALREAVNLLNAPPEVELAMPGVAGLSLKAGVHDAAGD
jgi:hypothetical protein